MKLSKDLKDLEAARERVEHSIEEANSNGEEVNKSLTSLHVAQRSKPFKSWVLSLGLP